MQRSGPLQYESTTASGAREVVRALAGLTSLIEPRLLRLWRETGVTWSQRRLLRQLRGGARPAGDVAAGLGITAPSLTRLMERLEQRGLLRRSIDERDRRRILIELTSAGQRSLADHRVFAGSPLARAAESLTADQQRVLVELIGVLVEDARLIADDATDE